MKLKDIKLFESDTGYSFNDLVSDLKKKYNTDEVVRDKLGEFSFPAIYISPDNGLKPIDSLDGFSEYFKSEKHTFDYINFEKNNIKSIPNMTGFTCIKFDISGNPITSFNDLPNILTFCFMKEMKSPIDFAGIQKGVIGKRLTVSFENKSDFKKCKNVSQILKMKEIPLIDFKDNKEFSILMNKAKQAINQKGDVDEAIQDILNWLTDKDISEDFFGEWE